MTTINLKDFYYWYIQDQFIEVSEEEAEALRASVRYEAAYQRRLTRHKAQYSLDCEDGIEYSACLHEPTPQELLERMELFVRLWNALNSLPEIQGRRIDAHIILIKHWYTMSQIVTGCCFTPARSIRSSTAFSPPIPKRTWFRPVRPKPGAFSLFAPVFRPFLHSAPCPENHRLATSS